MQLGAERGGEQGGADETAHPGHDRAGRHHRAAGQDRLLLGRLAGLSGLLLPRHADARAARMRRNSRTAIAPNSSATPVPMKTQMTLLTRFDRIGTSS